MVAGIGGVAFGIALTRMLTPPVPYYLWFEGIDAEPLAMDAGDLFRFVPLPLPGTGRSGATR